MIANITNILRDSAPINWGDVATWVTGFATLLLFIVALFQIRVERMARIKRERESETRARRDQAEHISCWVVTETTGDAISLVWVAVLNQSTQPVYQMIVSIYGVGQTGHYVQGDAPASKTTVGVAPPGKGYVGIPAGYAGMFRRPGVEIGFQDGAGNNWVRKPWGELLEIGISTMEYFHIDLPANWKGLYEELPTEKELYTPIDDARDLSEDETASLDIE